MDMERVLYLYYFFVVTMIPYIVLGLGKFFCVRVLYDAYDNLSEQIDDSLTPILCAGIFIILFAGISIYTDVTFMVVISLFAMCIGGFFLFIGTGIIVFCMIVGYTTLVHEKLKRKKNME